jgi:hypothetical protein
MAVPEGLPKVLAMVLATGTLGGIAVVTVAAVLVLVCRGTGVGTFFGVSMPRVSMLDRGVSSWIKSWLGG